MHLSVYAYKRKRTKSDSVTSQKAQHPPINPKSNVTTQKRHQKTSITQRLRTELGLSWCNDSQLTDVVKPVNGIPTFPLTAKLCNQKDTHL